MPWTREEAVEYGRKGGRKRAERRKLRKEDPEAAAKQLLLKASPTLAEFLLEVAKGEVEVDTKTRIEVAKTCLEYGLGKPAVRRETPKQADTPEDGLVLT